MEIKTQIKWQHNTYEVDWNESHSLGIPFRDQWPQVNCFHAPRFEVEPVRAGDFIGDTREGSPVNFKNVFLNPHGNGTHTECVGHITREQYSIHEVLTQFHYFSRLISIKPNTLENGARRIDRAQLEAIEGPWPEALVIRTLPNLTGKKERVYSGQHPPYIQAEAMEWMVDREIKHLLVDLPSVDPEEDGGALAAHKIFWQYPDSMRTEATISELIFVDNGIRDGLYLLLFHVLPFVLDATPSRPVLYDLNKIA